MNNLSKSIMNLFKLMNKIDNLDAESLLAHILARPREYIAAHPEKKIGIVKRLKFKYLACQRAKGIPLAYLTGHKEFFGLDFIVDKNVLIPRPETEILVEEVINNITYNLQAKSKGTLIPTSRRDYKLILIDVGTGSGCIPIGVIKTLKHKNIKTFAIDSSKSALKVAKKNAKKHNVEISFLKGNLLEPICKTLPLPGGAGGGLIITANLPYLTAEQYKKEKSIQHEPKIALIAKDDGLALYKELLQQIKQFSKTYNLKPTTYLEIDPSQSARISAFIKKILPSAEIKIIKDLAGLDRIVIVKIV